ncbi:MAG: enoyl-CoA hydratase/isomerase family protein [Gammaproteobacteria bacterium]|nr:enoyl-CoA hydratase/isomerase family protein [Gammaproteobacteria bacterium]
MSDYQSLKLEIDACGVATLTMSRAELHNAFDDQVIHELTEALRGIGDNPEVRVLVLRGEGKSFCAGADLNWMKRMAGYSWDENYQDSLGLAGLMQSLARLKMPSIAVVQGAAYGGGVGLVACCDMAFASDKASFCLSEVKLGLIPSVISPYVVRAMGERAARRYFVTAERFDAAEALRIGLVHSVVAPEALDEHVQGVVNAILANGPKAVLAAKRLIDFVANEKLDEDLIRETAQRIADIRASDEGREGVGAFLEKRKANWIKE